jgi:beta-lactam-binding protein with PASTA domain
VRKREAKAEAKLEIKKANADPWEAVFEETKSSAPENVISLLTPKKEARVSENDDDNCVWTQQRDANGNPVELSLHMREALGFWK